MPPSAPFPFRLLTSVAPDCPPPPSLKTLSQPRRRGSSQAGAAVGGRGRAAGDEGAAGDLRAAGRGGARSPAGKGRLLRAFIQNWLGGVGLRHHRPALLITAARGVCAASFSEITAAVGAASSPSAPHPSSSPVLLPFSASMAFSPLSGLSLLRHLRPHSSPSLPPLFSPPLAGDDHTVGRRPNGLWLLLLNACGHTGGPRLRLPGRERGRQGECQYGQQQPGPC